MSRPAGGIWSGCAQLEDTAAARPLKSRSYAGGSSRCPQSGIALSDMEHLCAAALPVRCVGP